MRKKKQEHIYVEEPKGVLYMIFKFLTKFAYGQVTKGNLKVAKKVDRIAGELEKRVK